jgi:WD40 repeat protein/tRNA A-37 threonylcarbamoyl transferase component Bud32
MTPAVLVPPVLCETPPVSDDSRLADLVSLWLRHFSEGRDVPAEELCGSEADLIPALERRLRLMRQMEQLAAKEGPKTQPEGDADPHQITHLQSTFPLAPGNGAPPPGGPPVDGAPEGYEILCELGRGGMAVVYKARQADLDRVIAIKMILSGDRAVPAELALLRDEAKAIARLNHPNIVQIYEVGEHNGLPFLTLEFCAGDSLDKKLRRGPLPGRDAAALVETLARAMQAAHEKDVIHRDLKPSNVLLTEDGTPKISDFGLARRLDVTVTPAQRALLGTPPYMAPEQVSLSGTSGPLTDVYALGAVLYECLTGRPPFRAPTVSDTLRQVLRNEPAAPRLLQPQVARDLDVICLTCLKKDPAKRYQSARDLADDLRRFLEGKPIRMRPPGLVERVRRWAWRNPELAGLIALVAFSLLMGTVISTIMAYRADKNWRDAVIAQEAAEAAQLRAEWALYASEIAHAQRGWQDNNLADGWQHLEATQPKLRGWEYDYLHALFLGNHRLLRAGSGRLNTVCFAPDGKTLASAGGNSGDEAIADKPEDVCLWDTQTGQTLFLLKGHKGAIRSLCFSRDGHYLASGGDDKVVRLWDFRAGGDPIVLKQHTAAVNAVCFSPDGKRLASGSDDRSVCIWDINTRKLVEKLKKEDGREKREGHEGVVLAVCFDPRGRYLYSGGDDCTVRIWDSETPKAPSVTLPCRRLVNAVCVSPDGRLVAAATGDTLNNDPGEVCLFDRVTRREVHVLREEDGPFLSVCFSRDGKHLATAGDDRKVRIWEVATNGEDVLLKGHLVFKGHADTVTAVSFAEDRKEDGKHLASAGADGTVRLWRTDRPQGPLVYTAHTDAVVTAAFSPDNERLASADKDEVHVWKAASGKDLLVLQAAGVSDVCFSPDGKLLAGAAQADTVRLWDAVTGEELPSLTAPARANAAADGGNVDPVAAERTICSVAFSPDSKRLAAGTAASGILVWEVTTDKEKATKEKQPLTLKGHAGWVQHVCFSPNGQRLASSGDDGKVCLWDLTTGNLLKTLEGHTGPVGTVCFSPDGKRLASASKDQTVRVWDAESGEALLKLPTHGATVSGLVFTPDSERLIGTANLNEGANHIGIAKQTIRVWVAATGLPVLTLRGHDGAITGVCLSPDGKRLATPSRDRTVRVWDAPTPPDE